MGGKITENLGFKSQQDIQKWLKNKYMKFFMENLKMKRKKGKKIDLPKRGFEP